MIDTPIRSRPYCGRFANIVMPISPPGDSDEARGSERLEDPAVGVEIENTDPFGAMPARPEAEDHITAAMTDDPARDAVFYEIEAAAAADPRRAAPLVHEIAYLREWRLGLEREAAKTFAQSLTTDPSFAPNAWALRRIFSPRGLWENLLRILDAEIRFATWPRLADRADLQVERGRLLEDRLGRERQAIESYRAALESTPEHVSALWALFFVTLRSGWSTEAEALAAVPRAVVEPAGRALLAVELARLQRGRIHDGLDREAVTRAAETLFRALAAGATADPVLRELDRLSLVVDQPDLRLRYLDAFESRHAGEGGARSGGTASALSSSDTEALLGGFREKACILLKRGARDAALAVLDRALRIVPTHRLALLDFLDVASEAGRADAIANLLDGLRADLPADVNAEALLRQAEMAIRSGALGEAVGTLARIAPDNPLAPLARLARLYALTALKDADGLSKALAEEADRLLEDGAADDHDRRAAAHLLVRAGAAAQREEGDGGINQADDFFRRARAVVPGYIPAAAGLGTLLIRSGHFGELATFLEDERVATNDPQRIRAITESLVTLYRDVLVDAPRALARQRELVTQASDVRAQLRVMDTAGLALPGTEATTAALASLDALVGCATNQSLAAALRVLGARIAQAAGRSTDALERFRRAFVDDPLAGAGAALEHVAIDAGDAAARKDGLLAELASAEEREKREVARALRFRLAFIAFRGGKLGDALEYMQPLRRAGDALALAWSLDLARQSGDAQAEISLLRDAETAGNAGGTGSSGWPADGDERVSPYERALAFAEILEQAGLTDATVRAYDEAAARGTESAAPVRRVDAELGRLAWAIRRQDAGATVAALSNLADVTDGETASALRDEADLLAWSAGLPASSADIPDNGSASLASWLKGIHCRNPALVVQGLDALAATAASPTAADELRATAGIRRAFLGQPDAGAELARACERQASVLVTVAATDLPLPAGPDKAASALAAVRRIRAERRARSSGGEAALAEILLLDEAWGAETTGRLGAAAAIYREVLVQWPESLEATEGIRRAARAAGNRRLEAAALARRGALARTPQRAAEAYAEAALLLQEERLDNDAAACFRRVLAHMPDDDHAYHRLKELLNRQEDATELEQLISFKLGRTDDRTARIPLLLDRARLRRDKLRQPQEAAQDFKRILQIDGQHSESLKFLGRLALGAGRPAAAARFLAYALDKESDEAELAAVRVDLAQAQESLGESERALITLTAAVEGRPEDPHPRECLVAMAGRMRRWDLALVHLRSLEGLAASVAERARVLVRIGRVERDGRRSARDALAAFRSALLLDPLGEAAGELETVIGRVDELLPPDRDALAGVLTDLQRALTESNPLDVPRLERLRSLAKLLGHPELAEVAGQLLAGLGAGGQRGRSRDLARPIGHAILNGLMSATDGPAGGLLLLEVWPLLAAGIARAEGTAATDFGASRQTRLAPGSEPRLVWLESAGLALGLNQLTIHVAAADDLAVLPFDSPEPTLVLGRGILAGDPGARFRAGRALFLLRQRAAAIERLSPVQLADLLLAGAHLAGARPTNVSDAAALKARIKSLSKGMARKELKAIESYRGRFETEPLGVEDWRAGILRGADRFGLLMAGDLAMALRVQTGRGEPTPEDLRRPDCLDLIRFAMSDRYAQVRRELGLPPSSLGDR